jgi:hypothetical protein
MKFKTSIVALSLLGSIYCQELLSLERSIKKEGLHRDIQSTFVFSAEEQTDCSFVISEVISKDIYIYLEEVLALKDFEFWPHYAQDIEKPASVAKTYDFIWRLPLKYNSDLNWI